MQGGGSCRERFWPPFSFKREWTKEELLEHLTQHMPADKLQDFKERFSRLEENQAQSLRHAVRQPLEVRVNKPILLSEAGLRKMTKRWGLKPKAFFRAVQAPKKRAHRLRKHLGLMDCQQLPKGARSLKELHAMRLTATEAFRWSYGLPGEQPWVEWIPPGLRRRRAAKLACKRRRKLQA